MTTVNLDDGSAVIGIAYDAQGNLAKKNGDVFSFDYGNRLRDGAGRESYAYDAQGRRVGSYSAALGDILSFYGNDGVLRRQHNKRTGKELEYISLGGSLVAELESLVVLGTPSLSGPATVATGTYTAAWTSFGNASRYELHGSINGGASWTAVYSGPAASYTVTGASTGARSYRVRACQVQPAAAGALLWWFKFYRYRQVRPRWLYLRRVSTEATRSRGRPLPAPRVTISRSVRAQLHGDPFMAPVAPAFH